MKATEILMSEHRVIERLLDTLDKAATRLEQGKPVRPEFFIETADNVIPPRYQVQVLEDFENIEHEETLEGVHEKYLELADKLAKEMNS